MPSAFPLPEWIMNLRDPARRGFLESYAGTLITSVGKFYDGDSGPIAFVPVVPTGGTGERLWDAPELTGAKLEFAIGNPDLSPVGGTFKLSNEAAAFVQAAVPYNVTATELAAMITAGTAPATVAKEGNTFVVTWTAAGARSLLTVDPDALQPECMATVSRIRVGTVSQSERQTIEIVQRPFAYTGGPLDDDTIFTPLPGPGGSVTLLQPGSATEAAIYRVKLIPEPVGGSFVLNYGAKETAKFQTTDNSGASLQLVRYACGADVANSLAGEYVDARDEDGPVRFWLSFNGAAAPEIPAGGRLVAVATIATNDTAAAVATKLAAVMEADAKFTAAAAGNVATATNVSYGNFGAPTAGTTGWSFSFTPGSFGRLHGKTVIENDAAGTVGIWFRGAAGFSAVPAEAAACLRQIPVTIAPNDSANSVAAAMQAAVTADSAFDADVLGNVVTVTAATAGSRATASGSTSGFGVTVTLLGSLVSATLPFNASAQQVQLALGEFFDVNATGPAQWDIAISYAATQPDGITLDASKLEAKMGWLMRLNLKTVNMIQAFADTTADEFGARLEGKLTMLGEGAYTFFVDDVTVARSVIKGASVGSSSAGGPFVGAGAELYLRTVDKYSAEDAAGTVSLAAVPTATLPMRTLGRFVHAVDGLRQYILVTAANAGSVGSTDTVNWTVIYPDDYDAGANDKVWLTV